MATWKDELREYGVDDVLIASIARTLKRGRTHRANLPYGLEAVYVDDDARVTIVTIDDNGKEHEQQYDDPE